MKIYSVIKIKHVGILLLSAVFYFSFFAAAQGAEGVPKILNHQGRLLDAAGNLLGEAGTNFCFRFSIFDNATVGLGAKLWPAGTPSTMTVNVKNGVFNVGIGNTSTGGDALGFNFQDNDTVFLNTEVAAQSGGSCVGVTFENLSPRQRIVSSGYTINSDTVDGFHAAQSASGNQIPVLTSGNLILGGINPQISASSTNALLLQGGATGDIQFFSASNKITSAGALTIAGALTSVGVNSGSGLLQGTGGLTITGATSLTQSSAATGVTINQSGAGTALSISNAPAVAQSVNTVSISTGANVSGASLLVNNSGTGAALQVQDAGIAVFTIDGSGNTLFEPVSDGTTVFTIQNAANTETLFAVDTTNNRIKIGDNDAAANPTTLLVLDTKADAGDPTGTNGAMYYTSSANKFRCFEGAVWKDCDITKESHIIFFASAAAIAF